MKTGIVDVGGGLRGIYAAGVLDYCMAEGIHFDLGIGGLGRLCQPDLLLRRAEGTQLYFLYGLLLPQGVYGR